MKKILAGILAMTSVLAMTVSASAAASNDKAVKAAGEVEYDVAVTAPKVVLDLIMPAKMAAALNPYGADIVLQAESAANAGDAVTTTAGIASVAYTITNNSKDYGVYFDATATTTTSNKDWKVEAKAPTNGTKGAQMALVGADDAQGIADIITAGIPTASAAFADPTQGVLVMDSTVVADKTKGIAAGQTSQKKFMYLPSAKANATDATKTDPATAAMAFVGKLADSSATADVEWTEDDAINVALVLKVVAGPKDASTPAGPGAAVNAGAQAEAAKVKVGGSSNGSTYDVAATAVSISSDTASAVIASSAVAFDFSSCDTTNYNVTVESATGDSSGTVNEAGMSLKYYQYGMGDTKITFSIKVAHKTDTNDTYTFTVVASKS